MIKAHGTVESFVISTRGTIKVIPLGCVRTIIMLRYGSQSPDTTSSFLYQYRL